MPQSSNIKKVPGNTESSYKKYLKKYFEEFQHRKSSVELTKIGARMILEVAIEGDIKKDYFLSGK